MPLGSVMASASAACSMAVAKRSALASARSRRTSLIARNTIPNTSRSMITMVRTTSRRLVSRMVTGRLITVAPTGRLDMGMPNASNLFQSNATSVDRCVTTGIELAGSPARMRTASFPACSPSRSAGEHAANNALTQAMFIHAVDGKAGVPGKLRSKFRHVYEDPVAIANERGSQDDGIVRECRHSVHELCDCRIRGKRKRSTVLELRDDALDGLANSKARLSEVRNDVDVVGVYMQPERQRECPGGVDLLGHARDILRSPEQRRLIVVDAAEHNRYAGKKTAAVVQCKVQRRIVSDDQDVGFAGTVACLQQFLDLIVVLLRGKLAPVEILHRELDPRR